MEIEMKYAVPSKEISDAIWDDPRIDVISDLSSAESVKMKAVYFDTEDGDLTKNHFSVRVRMEGDRRFATLKWGGTADENGLHQQNEVNIPFTDDSYFIQLDPKLFLVCDEGQHFLDIIDGKPLVNLLEMRFIRKRVRITYKNSVMELSVDSGTIITDKGDIPISEMEIELFSGQKEDVEAIGGILAQKYNLQPKLTNKFADGLALINEN